MMYDIIISENLRFCLFKGKRWANVFPNLHPQHRFQKPIFLVPKNIVHVWMEGYKNREKFYVFKNIQILVDRAWMITLPQGLAQVDQKHTLFCQQSLLGWNYQTNYMNSWQSVTDWANFDSFSITKSTYIHQESVGRLLLCERSFLQ